jgi:ribosomal protein S18 acetylase RimI-like enzyme
LEAATHLAKQRGAPKLILYSQRNLAAAIHLYRSCGFEEIPLCDQRYSRCDIKMQRAL